jgi:hypothetical protein
MTNYILHGGESSQPSPNKHRFFAQFTSLVDKPRVNILICTWARDSNDQDRVYQRDQELIRSASGDKVLTFTHTDSRQLENQLIDADVFYLGGGWSQFLDPHRDELMAVKPLLKDKVIIGSSMGAFYIATHYITSFDESWDKKTIEPGLGLIPINILCHWDKEQHPKIKLQSLSTQSPLPIITLNETEFVTVYH